jgi:outer membrane protein assembly factor BamB
MLLHSKLTGGSKMAEFSGNRWDSATLRLESTIFRLLRSTTNMMVTSEIENSKSLRAYGIALTLTHALTIFFWRDTLPAYLADRAGAICWPYFEACHAVRTQAPWPGVALLCIYAALTAGVVLLFGQSLRLQGESRANATRHATLGLFALTAFKFALFSIDYRLMGNYHYMAFFACAAFVLVPARRVFLPVLLCLFYVSAGLLKFNAEWLSGAALLRPSVLSGPLLHVALALVIPLELVLVWALTLNPKTDAHSRAWFLRAAVALVGFHAFSWHIVGYFYPCMMALLLSIFVLPWAFDELDEPSVFRRFFTGKAHRVHYACAAAFMLLQLPEHLGKGDSTLTGEGRLFGLNMLDATSVCDATAFARYAQRTEEHVFDNSSLGTRIHCDPIVFYNQARALCDRAKDDSSFRELDFYVNARRKTDKSFRAVIAAQEFCQRVTDYRVLGPNEWISAGPAVLSGPANGNPFAWAIPMGNSAPASAIQTMFRGDVARTGRVHESAVLYRTANHELFRVRNGNMGIHGASKSSPALDELGVYVGGDSGWFYAYDGQGHLRWSFFAGGAARGIHGSAAVDQTSVTFGAYNGRLYRLDKRTGALIWAIDLGDALGASPALFEDAVYVNVEINMPNGYLAKLSRTDGSLQWMSAAYGEQSHSSPAIDAASRTLFAGSNDYFFRAHDLDTGALRWGIHTEGTIKSSPAIDGETVFVTSRDKTLYAIHRSEGRVVWRYPLQASTRSSATPWPEATGVLVGDDSGTLHMVDAATGVARWTRTVESGFPIAASATIVGNESATLAFVACTARSVCVFDSEGAQVGTLPSKSVVTGVVAARAGRVCFSENSPGDLVCFGNAP